MQYPVLRTQWAVSKYNCDREDDKRQSHLSLFFVLFSLFLIYVEKYI